MYNLNTAYEMTSGGLFNGPVEWNAERIEQFNYTIKVVTPHIEAYEGQFKEYFDRYLQKIKEKHKHSLGYDSKVL